MHMMGFPGCKRNVRFSGKVIWMSGEQPEVKDARMQKPWKLIKLPNGLSESRGSSKLNA